MRKTIIGSLGRIADFDARPYDTMPLDKGDWETGDYVVGEVTGEATELYRIEDTRGDMIPVAAGDLVIGALGHRAATLEGVGSWTEVENGNMHCLTNAGLIGVFTSVSAFLPKPITLAYRGHVLRTGEKIRMSDFALRSSYTGFEVPTVLIVGTSMSAGKTLTGRLIVKELVELGLTVIGAKLTGAGRYRDILSFRHAGAAEILDFVDGGLPSTVVPEDVFRAAIRPLLCYIGERHPDFLVAEAGASPLEPYNGAAAIDELGKHICCTVLCASDPYAVVGVQQAFGLEPDMVCGPAANTSAGRNLVVKLAGVPAFNLFESDSLPGFREILGRRLGIAFPAD
ncbi:MAG: hypothetical protein OEW35_12935 [Gammaproteobacteria bacterium]|nr:hypothetical protein [Gammaproteobacteria bacterium]MDH4256295.1 hypothetical protein [Gammaproteobacteria bacterium]MDH5309360.1 hypothetical protein [Gammaproteobacteria bacterium]